MQQSHRAASSEVFWGRATSPEVIIIISVCLTLAVYILEPLDLLVSPLRDRSFNNGNKPAISRPKLFQPVSLGWENWSEVIKGNTRGTIGSSMINVLLMYTTIKFPQIVANTSPADRQI